MDPYGKSPGLDAAAQSFAQIIRTCLLSGRSVTKELWYVDWYPSGNPTRSSAGAIVTGVTSLVQQNDESHVAKAAPDDRGHWCALRDALAVMTGLAVTGIASRRMLACHNMNDSFCIRVSCNWLTCALIVQAAVGLVALQRQPASRLAEDGETGSASALFKVDAATSHAGRPRSSEIRLRLPCLRGCVQA